MNELPRAILIDLDDTILDDSGCVESCWADACVMATTRIQGLDAAELQREISAVARPFWDDPANHQRGRLDLRAATREIVTSTMRKMGIGDDAIAAEVAGYYRDLREERASVLPGAIETVQWLRERGVRLGMMTNGAGLAQRSKIERFELAVHFEHILIEGEFGYGKPDPRVFASLMEALRVKPDETWAIGDNIEVDVFGAMDAGIHGIWIDATGKGVPEGMTRRPDRIVASICELRTGGNDG